jgi:thiol-disulfide isomerase/thioredoxin
MRAQAYKMNFGVGRYDLRSRTRFHTLVVVLLLGSFAAAYAQVPSVPKSASAKTATAAKPADLPLIDLDGYNKILATYKGKPLLVTFWATWCEPCRDEYPMLVELAKQYAPKGLAVYGVSFDANADLHPMRDFLAKNRPGFPNYRQKPGIDVDAFYPGVNPEWSGTMPETIFYGRDGRILVHFEGEHTRDDFVKAIQEILASPASH